MFRTLTISAAALALTFSAASAQKLDANGRCHAANGQFAKAEVCGGVSKTTRTSKTTTTRTTSDSMAPAGPAATPAKSERCRDEKGHFTKCGTTTTTAAASPAPAADPKAPYRLDAKGKCHDARGRMAKKEMCAA